MTASPGSAPPAPPSGDAGSAALLAAMETTPAAVYFLTGPDCATVWANARARNVGWRIDYFLVSKSLKPKIKAAQVHADVMGSDHAPISLTLDL